MQLIAWLLLILGRFEDLPILYLWHIFKLCALTPKLFAVIPRFNYKLQWKIQNVINNNFARPCPINQLINDAQTGQPIIKILLSLSVEYFA